MQVATIAALTPLASEDKQTAQQTVTATPKLDPAKQEAAKPKEPFEPAPPIRPTLQDKIDINRSLLLLRKF